MVIGVTNRYREYETPFLEEPTNDYYLIKFDYEKSWNDIGTNWTYFIKEIGWYIVNKSSKNVCFCKWRIVNFSLTVEIF